MRLSAALLVLILTGPAVSCRSNDEHQSQLLDDQVAGENLSRSEVFALSDRKLFSGAVSQLHIHVHGDTWNKMITHRDQGGYACDDEAPYGHVKELKFIDSRTGETTIIHNAGIRVRGNTSCDDPADQKNFKIKLNPLDKVLKGPDGNEVWRFRKIYEEWGKGLNYPEDLAKKIRKQRLFGMESISLRRGMNDPTRMRDTIASDVFEYGGHLARQKGEPGAPEFGGPVYRSSVIWVRIHNGLGTLMEGHYGVVEHTDPEMVELHYGKAAAKGHLFKIKHAKGTLLDSDMPANLDRLLEYYQPETIDGEGFEDPAEYRVMMKLCQEGKFKVEKCDEATKQRKRAEEILRGLNHITKQALTKPTREERRAALQSYLDIDAILSYLAAANLTGHWDSMIGAMSNNDFLFLNKKTEKWSILVWDLDNTFGAGYQNYPWMANLDDFGVAWKYRPFFRGVLENFHDEYLKRVEEYLNGVYEFNNINSIITRVRDSVAPGNEEDRYKNLYRFAAHRFGNAWCHLKNGPGSKVKFKNGWPDIYEHNGRKVAACEPR